MRVLYLGEIVGSSGVYCVKKLLPTLKEKHRVDFTVAGGDGATGGYGTGKKHSAYLHKLGIDVLTGGECIYYKKDMVPHIEKAPYILRPANYPPENPGVGYRVYPAGSESIAVIVLLGQAGYDRVHLANPFSLLPTLVERLRTQTKRILLDFHANTTAEKQAMFHHADGIVGAVIGSQTKVLTSDERIMPRGTGVITDAGRTGSAESVGGLEPNIEIGKLLTQIPERSKAAWKRLEAQGVIVEIDESGTAISIERLRVEYREEDDETDRHGT